MQFLSYGFPIGDLQNKNTFNEKIKLFDLGVCNVRVLVKRGLSFLEFLGNALYKLCFEKLFGKKVFYCGNQNHKNPYRRVSFTIL